MNRHTRLIIHALALVAAGYAPLNPGTARADALTSYTAQVIARIGDKTSAGTFTNGFAVTQLNDSGQLTFGAYLDGNAAVVQYSNGKFNPIAVAGGPALNGGTWPVNDLFFWANYAGMNQAGDIAFVSGTAPGVSSGTYLWDPAKQTVIPVAVPGMPAVDNLVFTDGTGNAGAEIKNDNEVLFYGTVKDANNQTSTGLFLSDKDGHVQKVVLPGDPLPGQSGKVVSISNTGGFLNDAGQVAFNAVTTQVPNRLRTFLWESGTISVIADGDTVIPGFGRVIGAFTLMTNNKKSSVVVGARVVPGGPVGQFLWDNGQFTPVILPGQAMPGGGTYHNGPQPADWGWANDAGDYPSILQVDDGGVIRLAAYLISADGKLSLIAKSGMTTNLGTLTSINTNNSFHISLNSQGQVALTGQIDSGSDVLLLLTPKAP